MSPSSPIRFEVWGKKRLRFEELPTVHDVLARADTGLLASAIAECRATEAEWGGAEPPATADALRSIPAGNGLHAKDITNLQTLPRTTPSRLFNLSD